METLKKVNAQRTDRINRIGMGGMNLSRTQLKKKKGGGGVCKRRSSSEGRGSLFRKWEGIFFRKWEDLLRKGGRAIERQTWTRHRRAWKGSADALEQEGRRCAPPRAFNVFFFFFFVFFFFCFFFCFFVFVGFFFVFFFVFSGCCVDTVVVAAMESFTVPPTTCPLLLLHLCNVRSQLFSKKYCRWVLSSTFVTLFFIVRQKKQF